MRLLFSTFGSLGDVHPYIAVAREARVRGHEPIIATSEKYRKKIEAEDIGFRAIRPDLPESEEFAPLARRVMDGRSGSKYLFKELLSPTLRQNYEDLVAASADVDCLITHPAALGGPLAARKLKKKWISSVLAPISLWNKYDPPTLPNLELMNIFNPLWGAFTVKMGKWVSRAWIAEVYKLAEAEGIGPIGHPIFEGSHSPFGTVALYSQFFAPSSRALPQNTTLTGFCFFDKAGYADQRSGDWRAWLADGPPPLVFTLGSSAVYDSDAFFHESSRLATLLGQRAVFLTGGAVQWRHPLPDGHLEVEYAAYSELFPLAQAVIHQGGIGTTAQALRAGIPQIIVPFAHDQPDNAARMQRLGLGVQIPRQPYEHGGALPGFQKLLSDYAAYRDRAQKLAARIQAENGPRGACEAIERLV